jgi:hypothetical protein
VARPEEARVGAAATPTPWMGDGLARVVGRRGCLRHGCRTGLAYANRQRHCVLLLCQSKLVANHSLRVITILTEVIRTICIATTTSTCSY